jgi:hypothetical protein
MKQETEIPRALTAEIASCSYAAHRAFVKAMHRSRRKVVGKLREMGLSDREIGKLLGVTPQCICQQCPRKAPA